MADRHMLGDVVLALLLVLPTAALARPEAAPINSGMTTTAPLAHAAHDAPSKGRISLLG